ncbi:hypothetical protein [Caenibacillus caldisaponilyticus]|uniref:hypothetical protein n=1 Tax=Caenibacillus caldisaponilyticus TaxID=1674942 RepID=UPI000988574E|nr:hypothetical protein [Caenibacillus caldisaponilyticus]
MKKCINCGDSFEDGEGFPEVKNHKWECCCSEKCWLEFLDGDELEISDDDEIPMIIPQEVPPE